MSAGGVKKKGRDRGRGEAPPSGDEASLHRPSMSVGYLGRGGPVTAMAAVGLHQIDLHSAAKMDDTIAVVRLLKEGSNVDKRDPYG